jgi:hypothetical protein
VHNAAFSKLLARCIGELASERDEVDLYVESLDPRPLQRALRVCHPRTLKDAMEAAVRLEGEYKDVAEVRERPAQGAGGAPR